MSIQKYPIGHQDFAKIITEGFVYVDKTHFVHRLVERGGYYFLSRPRRFGKSLLVSTLEYLFKGKKELFEGLYIYDKWEFEEYPVIKISFANIGYREIPLEEAIIDHLESISIQCDTKINLKSASVAFKDLIVKLHQKFNQKVVVLIDEYDKPLIDYLDKENLHKAIENRAILKSFYSVLKDADAHLKMVFITGVSKFSQVSIFSDLNNLYDLTLKSEYNEICGISQVELEHHFAEELKIYDKSRIKDWYNGYRWNVNGDTIYNPFSILNFFTGDGALRDEVGYYRITGRVDDVVIVSGHNLVTAPIEDAINEHPAVAESAIIGFPHDIKGNALAGFIILKDETRNQENLQKEINDLISSKIGPIAKLDRIHFVSGLPKTRSGKIMRRILRKVSSNEMDSLGDTSTLLDPAIVDEIIEKVKEVVG